MSTVKKVKKGGRKVLRAVRAAKILYLSFTGFSVMERRQTTQLTREWKKGMQGGEWEVVRGIFFRGGLSEIDCVLDDVNSISPKGAEAR